MNSHLLIAGLDPAIHTESQQAPPVIMDAADLGLDRGPNVEMPKSDISDLGFKPAHDEVAYFADRRTMSLIRHARPCAGHPRLAELPRCKAVDGRVKPGHDEVGCRGPQREMSR
jgi:hypothetical protein